MKFETESGSVYELDYRFDWLDRVPLVRRLNDGEQWQELLNTPDIEVGYPAELHTKSLHEGTDVTIRTTSKVVRVHVE